VKDIPAPRRVLIVALDNLGDAVFASALTPPLHAAFPGATIGVWCKAYTEPVARLMPHVTEIIAADPFWARTPNQRRASVAPFLRSVLAARGGRYDVALLANAPWRTAAAVAAARIPVRIGLARRRSARFLTHVLSPEDSHEPVVRELLRVLEPLGIAGATPHYALDARGLEPLRSRVARQLAEAVGPRFVALHPFAGDPRRCVPLEEWRRLAAALGSAGLPVLWIGAPAELEVLRRSPIAAPGLYSDRLDDGTLRATAAALSLASAFVGHDSGPLHVAAAFGVPVVGVFAPGQPRRTFPQGTGPSIVIARATPREIDASMLRRALEQLDVFSAA
jgi:ADP-heptose:LPS heptosyltransferase